MMTQRLCQSTGLRTVLFFFPIDTTFSVKSRILRMSFKIQYVCHILLASENLLLSPSLEYFFEGKPE